MINVMSKGYGQWSTDLRRHAHALLAFPLRMVHTSEAMYASAQVCVVCVRPKKTPG